MIATMTVDPVPLMTERVRPEWDDFHATVSGPIAGVWTITMPDGVVTQKVLDDFCAALVGDDLVQSNLEALHVKAIQALTVNQTFLNLAAPTNAQTLAQVKTLTRETNALIRLIFRALSSTSGT